MIISFPNTVFDVIPNKKELHITAHANTPVLANELPVYPGKSSMWWVINIISYRAKKRKCPLFRTVYIRFPALYGDNQTLVKKEGALWFFRVVAHGIYCVI